MQSCLPDDDGKVSPVLKQLTKQPPIITRIDGLLSPAECDFLIQKAEEAGYQRSETEGRGRISAHRTSRTAYLPLDDKVVACIGERLATFAGMPADSLEQLQATRYGTDEQYRRHHDDDAAGGSKGHQRRLKTIFAYLHASGDLPTGKFGCATHFDELHQRDGEPLRVYPRAGSAVMWSNWNDAGERDLRT